MEIMVQGAQAVTTCKPKQIGIDTIILLADKGHSNYEIAKIVGCSPQNIQARLDRYDYNGLKSFRESKDKIFERLQADLAKSINADDIKNMAVRDRIMGIGILQDKIQALRGLPTDISLNYNVVKELDTRQKQLAETMRSLQAAPLDIVPSPDNGFISRDNVSPAIEHKHGEIQAIDITATNDAVSDNISYVNLRENVRDTGQATQGLRRVRGERGKDTRKRSKAISERKF